MFAYMLARVKTSKNSNDCLSGTTQPIELKCGMQVNEIIFRCKSRSQSQR